MEPFLSDISHVLEGVAAAAKISDRLRQVVAEWISRTKIEIQALIDEQRNTPGDTEIQAWCTALDHSDPTPSPAAKCIIQILLAVTALRSKSRLQLETTPKELSLIWFLIHTALSTSSDLTLTPSRSAQGFLAIPLCSFVTNGKLDELFRLHVWLPDSKRGKLGFEIHSHQSFAQSWILAGEGTDISYDVVDSTNEPAAATHSEHVPRWANAQQNKLGSVYSASRTTSQAISTGRLVRATESKIMTHRRNDSYSIPAAAYHQTIVPPDGFFATLFVFDAKQGFVGDAGVLGPVGGVDDVRNRDPGANTAQRLARVVEREKGREERGLEGIESGMNVVNFSE